MNRFDPLRKMMHVDEAVARFASQPGTVFTNGVFDLLHRGHIAYLGDQQRRVGPHPRQGSRPPDEP
jgi:bifunctional ADP-heptose synthase (sugar kinase/adenylyltransferase)